MKRAIKLLNHDCIKLILEQTDKRVLLRHLIADNCVADEYRNELGSGLRCVHPALASSGA